MVKRFVCFLLVFFLVFSNSLNAQAKSDSTMASDTAEINAGVAADSVRVSELDLNSLPEPEPDSLIIAGDSLREVPAQQIKSYILNPDYAYANDSAYWKKEKPRKPALKFNIFGNTFLRWTVFILILALVCFGINQLIKETSFNWRLRKTRYRETDRSGSPKEEEPDYEIAIRRYQEEGNYRLAIRYMYLRLIKKIRENDAFPVSHYSTNAELVRLFESLPFGNEFRYLTVAYEYIFYGGFIPGEVMYKTLKTKFEAFQRIITV
jgi:hypothetical protein